MTTSIIILCVCLFLSFFFSGTETAFTASSDALMHELEKKGNHRAYLVKKIKQKPDRFLGMILFGNNVVNITATAITTSLCVLFFGAKWGVIISTFGVSFVVLIFCEIMPKTFAIRNPNTIALLVAPVISFLTLILSPIVVFMNTVVQGAMKALGLLHQEKLGDSAKTELRGVIDMQKSDSIKSERLMLKSVLDLSDVHVNDVMIHRSKMVSLDATQPTRQLITKALNSPYTRIPLWKGKKDNIVGVLHVKSLFRALQNYTEDLDTFDVLTVASKPWFILETTSLLAQLQAFRRRHEHFALVIDEYGVLQGVITLEDVLEEIVGDIMDETDHPTEAALKIAPQMDGSVIVDGSSPIRDLNRHFGWDLPDDNFSTIAGLLLYETERIPKKDAVYSFYGFTFKVLEKKGNRVTGVLITPPAETTED